MSIFRNPEIKQESIYIFIGSFLFISVGFYINLACGFYSLFLCFIGWFSFLILMKERYSKMAQMSLMIDQILHGEKKFDFTEFKEGEMAILQDEIYKMTLRLKEQAEQLSKDKQYLADALANISHQIRTPLTSLNLMTERLRKQDLPEEVRRGLIQDMVKLLSKVDWLITVLLKLSKLDAGTIQLKQETAPWKRLIKAAAEPLLIPMELKQQEFALFAQGNELFYGDIAWTIESIGNILKNCVEHTPEGGKIMVHCLENPLYVEIQIRDTGVGVEKEELPHLFERFYRGKNAEQSSFGIGLALAKSIITIQEGSIKAECLEQGGMCFIIRFYKEVI